MTMAVDFVAGKAFEVLYAGVEDVIHKNRIFSELCKKIKPKLDRLAPVIQEMGKYNQMMGRTKELEDLEKLLSQGVVLLGKCSKLRNWNIYKKFKYASELLEFKESLQDELEVLEVLMARDVKKIEAGVENIQVDVQTMREEVSMLVKHNGSVEIAIEELSAVLPELPEFMVGMEVPIEELKVKLLKDKVSMLIVTAPGGCGKTTLATKVCQDQDIKDKFQNNIFFVTFTKKPNLELILKGLYEQKHYTVPTFQNEVTPVKWLKKVEKEKGDDHLLLVLDDVWSGSESLLEKFVYKMSNYKILVTSRSEFPRYGSSYHLPLLDHDNAMELFRHTASLGDKSSHIPKYLPKEIVKRCNGFPLAITVVGRSLCGQPEEMWQSRVDEWSEGSSILDDFETDLLLQLQSSVDVLDNAMSKVKECFLDLGVFPEDAQIEITALIDMWAELYDLQKETSCIAKLYELNNRSLVVLQKHEWFDGDSKTHKVVNEGFGYIVYTVRQHDLLRELAIYNSKRIPIEYRERLIIEISGNNFPKWWREQKYPHFNAHLVSISTDRELSVKFPTMELPEAEVLVLNLQSTTSYALPEFVERMDKLKVLLIMNYDQVLANLGNFQLLGSLSNLKSLRLDAIDLSCITENPVQLKNLHKLHLRRCMNLCEDPVRILHTFPNLKEMVIERSWGLPAELCVPTSLTKLKLSYCRCSVLPEAIGNLVNLEQLRLELTLFSEISDSIGNLKKLIFFEICGDSRIIMLPEHIGKLTCLRHLILKNCMCLRTLPESIGNLVNLEVLTLRGCSISYLPESIRNLQKLNFLDIGVCFDVRDLPEHIGELRSLRKLDMAYCYRVRKLPPSVVDLEQLEEVICTPHQADGLWAPLSATLKNLSIVLKDELKTQLYDLSED